MKEEQNIDQFFKDKLGELNTKPSDKVWAGIENKLTVKKKRILPIWWFSSGIAALFILGLFLFPFINEEENRPVIKQNFEIVKTKPIQKEEFKNNEEVVTLEKSTKEKVIIKESIKEVFISNKAEPTKDHKIAVKLKNEKKNKEILENDFKTTAKESTLDSKIAMKKNFLLKEKKEKVVEKADKKLFQQTKKKSFLAVIPEQKSIEIDKKPIKKWSISPSFAVLNSNSFSNTSSLDNKLNGNNTTGENTYSYGVKVSYKLNKKLTLQSGIHSQEMGFLTNDVSVSASLSRQSLKNVNSSVAVAFNNVQSSFIDVSATNLSLLNESGDINQRFGYIEVPLELKYNIKETEKLKTELVSGFSSLFLNSNTISLVSDSFSRNIGEANNLNSLNFSGNLGVDFNYSINKNLQFNLNPMFKAYLNTFSENSNNFQPFFLGVYTGLKYQF